MKADLILVNGAIHTMDRAKPRAKTIAIAGNRVLAVGSNAEMRDLKAPGGRIVDLRGVHRACPVFTDAHLHFLCYGISLRRSTWPESPRWRKRWLAWRHARCQRQPVNGSTAAAGIIPCGAGGEVFAPGKTWTVSRPVIRSSCGASAATSVGRTHERCTWLASPQKPRIPTVALSTEIRSPGSRRAS